MYALRNNSVAFVKFYFAVRLTQNRVLSTYCGVNFPLPINRRTWQLGLRRYVDGQVNLK